MYAVIKNGGKQYRVTPGLRIKLELMPVEPGAEIDLGPVLMVGEGDSVKIGAPEVAGASVKAKVLDNGRHKKISIIKFKRRKHHMKRQGHRQHYTEVEITNIQG